MGKATQGHFPWRIEATLLVILLGALWLRLVFYAGFFGSDDTTYVERAVAWSLGDHSIPEYIGANRLGITLPVAGLIALLGCHEFTANLWSLLCSLGELALVWHIGMRFGGRRLATLSTLLLALTPLHIHYAGRMMADSPLCFFMTLSAASILAGRNDDWRGTAVSGLAAGGVFWIKPPVAIFSLVILALMIFERRSLRHYLIWGCAAATIVLGNLVMMWLYAGDPLFILKAMSKRLAVIVSVGNEDKRPYTYLLWLLADLRFTWLLGWLSVFGVFFGLRDVQMRAATARFFIWSGGLVLVFSLWPASVFPLKLIFKQSNYMTMFLAPLALAGGVFLNRLASRYRIAVMLVFGAGGLFLAALLQADIQSFTANARVLPNLVKHHPDTTFYLGSTGGAAVDFDRALTAANLGDLRPANVKALAEGSKARRGEPAIAVFDPVSGPHRRDPAGTDGWPNATCWLPYDEHLSSAPLSWPGDLAVRVVRLSLRAIPNATLNSYADHFMASMPMVILRLDPGCEAASEP